MQTSGAVALYKVVALAGQCQINSTLGVVGSDPDEALALEVFELSVGLGFIAAVTVFDT